MDARTRKMAGLALVTVGVVLAVVGGLADQIGIGANDEGEMGGKQIAALAVGILLVIGGAVLATVLAKDDGEVGEVGAGDAAAGSAGGATVTDTPAAGTPVAADDTTVADTDVAEASAAEAERIEATDSSD